ncbi:MAG: hypothetical protein MZV65_30750 [Chromatiales bacterium]|nr:hypothetical protein [Chromatiales bacterium]
MQSTQGRRGCRVPEPHLRHLPPDDGKITGNQESLFRPAWPGGAQCGHQSRITGEGRVEGPTISGGAWEAEANVTGTEGHIAAERNPSERAGTTAGFANSTVFKGKGNRHAGAAPDRDRPVVDARPVAAFPRVTLSGGRAALNERRRNDADHASCTHDARGSPPGLAPRCAGRVAASCRPQSVCGAVRPVTGSQPGYAPRPARIRFTMPATTGACWSARARSRRPSMRSNRPCRKWRRCNRTRVCAIAFRRLVVSRLGFNLPSDCLSSTWVAPLNMRGLCAARISDLPGAGRTRLRPQSG